jgi:putative membrane protein
MIKAYRRFALWAAVLLSAAAMSAPAVAQIPQYDGPHMWGMGWHGWFFGSIMMAIFMTALIALIVVLAWRAGAGTHVHTPHLPATKTPLDILKERFARGEIDKTEFEERRRILGE